MTELQNNRQDQVQRAIVVDAGNSNVVIARWRREPGRPERLERISQEPTPLVPEAREVWAAALAETVAREGGGPLVLVSVVPELNEPVQQVIPEVLAIDHTLSFPFRLDLEEPAAVGADRYCNVAAAVRAGWRDALIVDAGTATTFDLLQDSCFAGGLIAPGMAFASSQLGREAARLQPVPFAPCPLEVGRNTAAAMQTGAFHVAVHGVRATIKALLARYGDRPVVLTGGLGELLKRPGWEYRPDWTLTGAVFLVTG